MAPPEKSAILPKPISDFPTWSQYKVSVPPDGAAAEASISTEINNALVLCLAPLEALAVDAIINPTDTALSHGEAALPRKISAAAGPGLAEECLRHGKLQLGHAMITQAHRLPCKIVVHTALPRFDPSFRAACGAALAESLASSLRLFTSHTSPPLSSIAVPVLHSDEQQWPEEWACRGTLKVLRSWLEAQPLPLPKVILCCQRAEQCEIFEAHLPSYFPRPTDAPTGGDAMPFAAAGPTPQQAVPATGASGDAARAAGTSASLLQSHAVSSLGSGKDDWSGDRFALSREAMGVGLEADLGALTADIAAAGLLRYVGQDRKGRPTLLLLADRLVPFLAPDQRDRALLYAVKRIEPIASASGTAGFAMMVVLTDKFSWELDLAWLQAARTRLQTEAPGYGTKLRALYLLRPTAFVRNALSVARAFMTDEAYGIMHTLEDPDVELSTYFDLKAIKMPHGVHIRGVQSAGESEAEPNFPPEPKPPAARENARRRSPPRGGGGAATGGGSSTTSAYVTAATTAGAQPKGAAATNVPDGTAVNTSCFDAVGDASAAGATAGSLGHTTSALAARAASDARSTVEEEMRTELAILQDEKVAAQRDRDYYRARLDQERQLRSSTSADGGNGNGKATVAAAVERAAAQMELKLHATHAQLAKAETDAEAARAQSTAALREKAQLRAEIASIAERLSAAEAEKEALAHADGRVRHLVQEASTRAVATAAGGGAGGLAPHLLEEMTVELHRTVADRRAEAAQRQQERANSRQEAAALRTEVLSLRAERESHLSKLHAALAAADNLRKESCEHILQVRTEAEGAATRLRADRDALSAKVAMAVEQLQEARAERDAAWAHGKMDRELLDRELRRAHALLHASRNEKEEGAYLARQEKQILANELRSRHAEALALRETHAKERAEASVRGAAAEAAKDALQANVQSLMADLASAEAASAATREQMAAMRSEDAERSKRLNRAVEEAARLGGRLQGREESGGIHAEAVNALGVRWQAHAQQGDETLKALATKVDNLSNLIAGGGGGGVDQKVVVSDAGSRPPSTSLAGMFEALRSDAGLQRRVDEMGGCLLAYHRFLAESSARLKGQSRQARAAVEAVERTLKDPSLDEAPGSAQTTPWPEWPSAGGSSDAGVVVSASPPPASLRPEALQAAIDAEQTEMQEQLKTMLTASGGLLGACAGLRSELAASRAALRRARDQEASVANRMEEVAAEAAKDKQFLLTVVNTLKDQLGEERAERARMRSALDASGATQQKTLDALQAAHDAALRPHARAADITRNARKACQALHGRLDAFCAKWVPHGAEPEKLAILEELKQVEVVLAQGPE